MRIAVAAVAAAVAVVLAPTPIAFADETGSSQHDNQTKPQKPTSTAGQKQASLSPSAATQKSPSASQASQGKPMPEPPASAPRWLKRIVKRVNRFIERHPGPFPSGPYEPGKTNIGCRLSGTC